MNSGYVYTNKGNQLLGLSDSSDAEIKSWIQDYLNKYSGSDKSWYEFMDHRIQKRKNDPVENMDAEEKAQREYYQQFNFNTSSIISEWQSEYPELFGITPSNSDQFMSAGVGGNQTVLLVGGVLIASGITYYLTKNKL